MTQNKRLKHSKFRNPGILFELLAKQVTSDILSGRDSSNATSILKKYFNENTEMSKELKIYKFISEEKTKDAVQSERLLEIAIKSRKKLNNAKLSSEKFELIKEIKNNWNVDDFMKGSVGNYKLMASIYKILEESVRQDVEINPKELYQAKNFIFEHVSTNTPKKRLMEEDKDETLKLYKEQSNEIRLLTYKLLIDSFNKKYSVLNESQKGLIKEYIYNVSNTNSLKSYMNKIIPDMKKTLIELMNTKVDDSAIKIKLNEIYKQLGLILESKQIKDSHITSTLISMEIIKELQNL